MIINNRDKIQSEIATKKYAANWDRIFGSKKDNIATTKPTLLKDRK